MVSDRMATATITEELQMFSKHLPSIETSGPNGQIVLWKMIKIGFRVVIISSVSNFQ